jgi:hypothetical protein
VEQLALLHPGKVFIVEGKFQADSYIQHLLVTEQVDLAIGNDADFSFIAGGACLQVSAFDIKVNKKDATDIKNITIATGFKNTIDLARNHLGSIGTYKAAELPLLDGLTDVRTRCLIAVLLANDTFPKELKRHTCLHGIGPAAVRDMINRIHNRQTGGLDVKFDDLLEEALHSLPAKNKDPTTLTQLPAKVVKAFVEAMAYEPATVAASGELLYSVTPPTVPLDHFEKGLRQRSCCGSRIDL